MMTLILIATLLTSLVSGVLSMAGGMILMGIFGFLLSVPSAMVLHGVAQTASNGSRVWLYRHHIKWSVLVPYSIGALVVLMTFLLVQFVPSKAIVFILIGSFPFLALIIPASINLDIEKKSVAFTSGILVTLAQMLAGASGPVLDVFYVKSRLTRHEVMGTKAVTQTLGHLIKLSYYAFFLTSFGSELPVWLFPLVVLAAVAGNRLGKVVVERINDAIFRQLGRYLIMIIGAIYIGKGCADLFSSL